jgi:hypothetical protein
MVNMLNRRNLILSPLLSASLVLIIFVYSTQAALLKDIRIGEYDNFTRIVFELDSPIKPEHIVRISSGQLSVVFADTSAEFIRKIPVERSRHIKNIQLWEKTNQLSAVFSFDFEHFRHESFPLNNPPRIVLDIQPMAIAPESVVTGPPAESKASGETLAQEAKSKTPESSLFKVRKSPVPVGEINPAGTGAEPNDSPILAVSPKNDPMTPATRTSDLDYADKKTDEPRIKGPVPVHQKPATRTSRLQFYLVVVLVLITIAILVFLLLMLLSRHRWANDEPHLKPKEFLKDQDKHIASLDARIKEQLKRYEEA